MFIDANNEIDAQDYVENLLGLKLTGMGEYVIDTQMGWNILKKEGSSNQYYCSMTGFENGVGVCRLIEIESDNWDNMKVVNIVNKIIDNTTGSSF